MPDPVLYSMAKQQARYWLSRCWRDRPGLLVFMFHAVVEDRDRLNCRLIDPALCITLSEFREFIKYYLEAGYQFVAPNDVVSGLPNEGGYVLITFDDGYFNNRLVVPILNELQVPAVFSIATGYVENGKSFWWDVLFRQRTKRGAPRREIANEAEHLKSLHWTKIEPYLIREFGARSLEPTSDADRPFTPNELAEFSREPQVHLGNHTRDHAILTNHDAEEIRSQIAAAQDDLSRICGVTAELIAYPNGAQSAQVRQAAGDLGLGLGVSVEKRKNYFPLNQGSLNLMNLGRFEIRCGQPLIRQLEIFRGDLRSGKRNKRAA